MSESDEFVHDACDGQWCCGCDVHPVGKPWGWNSRRWDEHYEAKHSGSPAPEQAE